MVTVSFKYLFSSISLILIKEIVDAKTDSQKKATVSAVNIDGHCRLFHLGEKFVEMLCLIYLSQNSKS